jgi:hypothetical protein
VTALSNGEFPKTNVSTVRLQPARHDMGSFGRKIAGDTHLRSELGEPEDRLDLREMTGHLERRNLRNEAFDERPDRGVRCHLSLWLACGFPERVDHS